jgi:hypothetical protein
MFFLFLSWPMIRRRGVQAVWRLPDFFTGKPTV